MKGKKKAVVVALGLVLLLELSTSALALEAAELVPVGTTVGIELEMGGVMVVGVTDVETPDGTASPAADAGLKSGDVITGIGARRTATAAEFLTAISELDGGEVGVTAQRNGQEVLFTVRPAQTVEGAYQMGLWLRDGISGIGTVTFYDPASGTFGALGHGINDLDTGELLPFQSGCITGADVVDVVRGAAGSPGELCGQCDGETLLGDLKKNTDGGIFGTGDFSASGELVPVATEEEVQLGPATILANVCGCETGEYSVEISRIYRDGGDNRFLLLTVTDRTLLEKTGGIVQGMSGSPILQNGKIIGAVTHVLLNDPTRGYGISIQSMLDAAA